MHKLLWMIGLFFLNGMAFGQVAWMNDLKVAQALALTHGKLIVVDFWAVWCGPCKMMDKGLWQKAEMTELSSRFIPLKIDVDINPILARDFGANAIPKVIIMDAGSNVLWEMTGYRAPDVYLDVLKNLPSSVNDLNKCLLPFIHHKDRPEDQYQLALAYQQLGKQTSHRSLQNAFLEMSSNYFRKVAKKAENDDLQEKSALHMILNEAYGGHAKQALKQAEKLKSTENEATTDLKKFIQAYCYQCEGQADRATQLKKEIKNKDYIAELENL